MQRMEPYRPFWIEEPVRADNLAAMTRIAEALITPVATGELKAAALNWLSSGSASLEAGGVYGFAVYPLLKSVTWP